jgi:hypothetical protein
MHGLSKYDEVEWPHIVPAGYLRGFAEAAGSLSMMSSRVGPRNGLSRRSEHDSGTTPGPGPKPGNASTTLSGVCLISTNRVQVLREAADHFPFSEEDRAVIAQFAGAQLVRVPRWGERRAAHDAAIPLPSGPTPEPATDGDRL